MVGGCVRDHLLDRPVKDWDVEVFGLPGARLESLLRKLGRVDAVGRSFGVYKSRPRGWRGEEIDVSIPRRDSKVGPGHRGIAVEGDPNMSIREAARRRDLTINAIMYDLQVNAIVDPWGGLDDLHTRVLRPVDAETFLEDPLRALRAAQFAARLGFTPSADLTSLSRTASLDELPAERVQVEWEKLLLKGSVPSRGFAFARQANILQRVFPEAAASDGPDVDVRIDAMVRHRESVSGRGRRWALMLAAWLRGLETAAIEATLDRLWLHRVERCDLRPTVHALASRSMPTEPTDRELRELSTAVEVDLALCLAETLGTDTSLARTRARELGVLHAPPPALVQGRDLMAAGVRPGPRIGELLRETYAAQLRGEFQDREDALAYVLARASSD